MTTKSDDKKAEIYLEVFTTFRLCGWLRFLPRKMESQKKHLSITGKLVSDEPEAPSHTMVAGRPVPIAPEVAALGFDKVEEEKAVCDLRNISKKEIKRRQKISNVGLVLSLFGVAFFMYKDSDLPRYLRFSMIGPFSLWSGFYLSAKAGI